MLPGRLQRPEPCRAAVSPAVTRHPLPAPVPGCSPPCHICTEHSTATKGLRLETELVGAGPLTGPCGEEGPLPAIRVGVMAGATHRGVFGAIGQRPGCGPFAPVREAAASLEGCGSRGGQAVCAG